MTASKVALVTGASSGMGKEFARRLNAQGYKVYGAARRVEKMEELKKLGIVPVKMDITDQKDIDAVSDKILSEEGRLDVLINNAGFGLYGSVEEISLADARYQFEVNFFGLVALTKKFLPLMRTQKSGAIFNISSMGGSLYTPLGSYYHATKYALEAWSDCLRLEMAPFGLKIVIIKPGMIETEFDRLMLDSLEKYSGDGPYAHMVAGYKKTLGQGLKASPPRVISDLIFKALKARRPKTRYVAGKFAKPMLFIHKWLGYRIYDWVAMRLAK